MNPMKPKSQGIYFIAGIFIFLLAVQVVLYGNFFNELKSGTEVINDLKRVDSALYLAKGNGRNRTEVLGGEPNNE